MRVVMNDPPKITILGNLDPGHVFSPEPKPKSDISRYYIKTAMLGSTRLPMVMDAVSGEVFEWKNNDVVRHFPDATLIVDPKPKEK